MKTYISLILSVVVACCGLTSARTWTSADGSKSFEADFVKEEEGKITIKRSNGKIQTFSMDKVSLADQQWVDDQKDKALTKEIASRKSDERKNNPIPKELYGNLVKLNKKSFKRYKTELFPEYYILYYSASW